VLVDMARRNDDASCDDGRAPTNKAAPTYEKVVEARTTTVLLLLDRASTNSRDNVVKVQPPSLWRAMLLLKVVGRGRMSHRFRRSAGRLLWLVTKSEELVLVA